MPRNGWAYLLALVTSVAIASLLLLLGSTGLPARAEEPGDPVLVAAGDVHASCSSRSDEATAALLASIGGTVAGLGDNAAPPGSLQLYEDCYGPSWGAYKPQTRPTPGNHDYDTPGAAGYFDYFGAAAGDPSKGYYSYDLGSWHVVVLNSNCAQMSGCDVDSPQERWLAADLAAHPADCTLAYWHRPRFTSGSSSNDKAVAPFWEDLYAAGADVVLNAHTHGYERFAPQDFLAKADPAQGIREFVVGTGGQSLSPYTGTPQPNSEVRMADKKGVLKLTLHPQGYDWEFVTVPEGAVADSGGTGCHDAPADNTPPVAQPPSPNVPLNSTLDAGATPTIPVNLSWSATDDQSGIVGYILRQSADGGATFTRTPLSWTTKIFQLQPDGTYRFGVKATDSAGNRNEWADGPPFVIDPEQEDSDAVTYAGAWTPQASGAAYGGGISHSATKNDTARFAFTGRNVAWVATKGPDGGRARILVDGRAIKTVDLYASTGQPRKVVFSKAGLDPTTAHTLTVQVLGTKSTSSSGTRVNVDAFVALR